MQERCCALQPRQISPRYQLGMSLELLAVAAATVENGSSLHGEGRSAITQVQAQTENRRYQLSGMSQTVEDLWAHNSDLRLLIAFYERDASMLRKEIEAKASKNSSISDQLRLAVKESAGWKRRIDELEELVELIKEADGMVSTFLIS